LAVYGHQDRLHKLALCRISPSCCPSRW
jgi:hypothetical protein